MSHYLSNVQSSQQHNVPSYEKTASSFPTSTRNIPVCTNREKQIDMMSFEESTMQNSASLDSAAILYNNYPERSHENTISKDNNALNT